MSIKHGKLDISAVDDDDDNDISRKVWEWWLILHDYEMALEIWEAWYYEYKKVEISLVDN